MTRPTTNQALVPATAATRYEDSLPEQRFDVTVFQRNDDGTAEWTTYPVPANDYDEAIDNVHDFMTAKLISVVDPRPTNDRPAVVLNFTGVFPGRLSGGPDDLPRPQL